MAEHRVNVVGNWAEACAEAEKLLQKAKNRGLLCEVKVKTVFVSPDGTGKHMRRLRGVFVITGETSKQDTETLKRIQKPCEAAEAAA